MPKTLKNTPTKALIKIPFQHQFIEATFLERPNRFIGVFQHPEEPEPQRGHIADPGRLKELLLPGAKILVVDHGQNAKRKLRYSIPLVYNENGLLVSINSQLPNRLVQTLLESYQLPGFEEYQLIRREFTVGNSRIDFLLESPQGQKTLIEVKGASLVEGGVCKFPDAPTERGARHVRELIDAQQDGYECHVVIVVQRADAQTFEPHYKRDPKFAAAMRDAIDRGVNCHAFTFDITPEHCELQHQIPIIIPDELKLLS